jgi:hypothetical protein
MARHSLILDRLAGVLPTVLQRVDPERRLRAYAVWNCWNEVVGSAIAARAQPSRFRDGILFVSVASHTWMQELQFMKEEIRDRLNVRIGECSPPLIRDIFFVSGSVTNTPRVANDRAEPAQVPVEEEPSTPPLPSSGDARFDAALVRVLRARARRRTRGA